MIVPPVLARSGWVSLPFYFMRALNGNSRLPIYECDKTTVETKQARVRPLGKAKEELSFSAWQMAHALKKADCAREPSPALLAMGAAGFLLENVHLFDWRGEELRLSAGMSDYYADFTRTGLAGRVAQGIALLFLEKQGYAYIARLSAEIKRQNGQTVAQGLLKSKAKKSGARPPKEPDFIIENGNRERALAEAKGAFVAPNAMCDIKRPLREALDQLDGWDRVLDPQPQKNFAVRTFLRETDDFFGEPSLIAFVDPEPGQPKHSIDVPPDAIRRANYASWLALMGFDDAAERLRTRAGGGQRRTVPLIRLHGRPYVITIMSMRPWSARRGPDADFWPSLDDWPHRFFRPDGFCVEVVGMDLEVIRVVGAALDQHPMDLMSLHPQDGRDISGEIDGGRFYGSVLLDGSLFGEIRVQRSDRYGFESTEVEL